MVGTVSTVSGVSEGFSEEVVKETPHGCLVEEIHQENGLFIEHHTLGPCVPTADACGQTTTPL